jgi:hypothetical protein
MASALIAPLIGGLAGLIPSTTTTKTNSSSNNQGSSESNAQGQTAGSTTPNLSPFQQQLAQQFTNSATNLNNSATNLAPYTTGGLQQIQNQGGANQQILANTMAGRGLSYSPAGTAALNQNTINTGNQASTFLQSIPLLQRQLQTQSLQGLISSFGALPTGVSSTGSSTQTGSGSSQSSGQAASTQTSTGGGGIGGAIAGAGAGLFAPGGGTPQFNPVTGGSTPTSALSNILQWF